MGCAMIGFLLAVVTAWYTFVLPESSLAKLRGAIVDSVYVHLCTRSANGGPSIVAKFDITPVFRGRKIHKATWSEILWGELKEGRR